MFFRVNQYFDYIIVNVENITFNKYLAQNGTGMFWAI